MVCRGSAYKGAPSKVIIKACVCFGWSAVPFDVTTEARCKEGGVAGLWGALVVEASSVLRVEWCEMQWWEVQI